jgi:hypothetical protein
MEVLTHVTFIQIFLWLFYIHNTIFIAVLAETHTELPNAGHGLLILRFLDHTQRRTTVGKTPLDE